MQTYIDALQQLEPPQRNSDWTLALGLLQALNAADITYDGGWHRQGQPVDSLQLLTLAMQTLTRHQVNWRFRKEKKHLTDALTLCETLVQL